MHQEYYIIANQTRVGPYDLVAVVRKIRNGSITAQTPLQQSEDETPKPAQDWPELYEFFFEKKEEQKPIVIDATASKNHTLSAVLKSGAHFLARNHYSTVFSGLIVLIVILLAGIISFLLPPALRVLGYMACFILGYFMIACYTLSVLRMARGQPMDVTYMVGKIRPVIKPLFLSSVFICIPAVIGLALILSGLNSIVMLAGLFIFAVPGLFTLTLYVFTPILIMDKGSEVWECMEASRKSVLSGGHENLGVIYALFVINFLAGLCILLPMAITLPITMGALAEIYDETFS